MRSRAREADFLGGKETGWADCSGMANDLPFLCLSGWPLTVRENLAQGAMWFNCYLC